MELTFCELKEKVVFNVVDGKRLGRVVDVTFTRMGQVTGIVVPGDKKIFKCISSGENIFIPWNSIVKIGADAILVELGAGGCSLLQCGCDIGANCQ